VEGGAILPWLPSRDLSEEEACRAELGRPIPRGALADPVWPLPPGFPGPDPCPVLGLCGGRLRVLLRAEGALLRLQRDLGGGI
jgi:tRNA pseudouridine55 synthase